MALIADFKVLVESKSWMDMRFRQSRYENIKYFCLSIHDQYARPTGGEGLVLN